MKEKCYNIAVAGTGYVGLSIAVLLAQHNSVCAVDVIPELIIEYRQLKMNISKNISRKKQ